MDILVREAMLDDAPGIADLMTQLGYPSTDEEERDRLESILSDNNYRTYIAEENRQISGVIGANRNLYYERNGTFIQVIVLAVDQQARGKGIASLLIGKIEEWAVASGALHIKLTCGNREEREMAHRFYSRKGFKITSTAYIKRVDS